MAAIFCVLPGHTKSSGVTGLLQVRIVSTTDDVSLGFPADHVEVSARKPRSESQQTFTQEAQAAPAAMLSH